MRCIVALVFKIVFHEGHWFCKVRLLLSLLVVTCHYIWLCLWLVLFAVTKKECGLDLFR